MKCVDILHRVDGVYHAALTYMFWQRKLDKYAVYIVAPIQRGNQLKELSFCCGGGEGKFFAMYPAFGTVLFLVCDIYPGGGVVPHEDYRKPRHYAKLGKPCDLLFYLQTIFLCNGLAVNYRGWPVIPPFYPQ